MYQTVVVCMTLDLILQGERFDVLFGYSLLAFCFWFEDTHFVYLLELSIDTSL